MSFQISLALGLGFGLLAAMLAFVICFEAYRRQQFAPALIWRDSLTAAAFTIAVFLAASIALGYLLKGII